MAHNMKNHGYHILCDLYGCKNRINLKYADSLMLALKQEAERIGLTVVGVASHQFQPCGATGVLVLAESHVSVHTWVDEQHATIDIFTCGSHNTQKTEQMRVALVNILEADDELSVTTRIKRGHHSETNAPMPHELLIPIRKGA